MFGLAAVAAWKLLHRLGSEEDEGSSGEPTNGEAMMFVYGVLIAVVLTAVAAFQGGSLVHDLVMRLQAPEYMAIQDMMTQLGEVIQ